MIREGVLRCYQLLVFSTLALFLADGAASLEVEAWWEKGHGIIVENAALKIPGDMPAFLKANIRPLKHYSIEPDQWKNFGNELKLSEEPNHYLDLERLTNNPYKFRFAEDRYAAINLYATTNDTAKSVGLLPYQIIEYYQRLRGALAQYRQNPADPIIQSAIIEYAGILSHYAGDTAQPLHTTVHYDGRVDARGKIVKNQGIHGRFEGTFVESYIEGKDCLSFIKAAMQYSNIYDAIREAIARSFENVDEVYRLDDAGKLTHPDAATKQFVQKRLAHGSQFSLNLWYTAWKESERPN